MFYAVLSMIGHTSVDDREDYSMARFLKPEAQKDLATGVAAVQQESNRYLQGAGDVHGDRRGAENAPDDVDAHHDELDVLSREIRNYTAAMLRPDMPADTADLLASIVEEEDWTASLGETLYQIARRVERQPFSAPGKELVNATLDQVTDAMRAIVPDGKGSLVSAEAADREPTLQQLRERCLKLGDQLPWEERGAILTLLGSAERAFDLIERIDEERRSVPRPIAAVAPAPREAGVPDAAPVPA